MSGLNAYLIVLPYLLLGLVIFSILLAAVYLLLHPFRDDPVQPGANGSSESSSFTNGSFLEESPGGLSAAEAGCLASPGCQAGWDQGLGGLLDLAAAGIVAVEQLPTVGKSSSTTASYQLRLVGSFEERSAFERGLLEAFFLREDGLDEAVLLEEAARRFPARLRRFKQPLLAGLRGKDLIDPAREQARKYLRLLALFSGLAGAISLVLGLWLASSRGGWAALLIPAGFLAGGLVAFLQAGSFSICTRQGRELGEHWLEFGKSLARSGLPDSLISLREKRQQAYLASLGLLPIWLGQLKPGSPAAPPAWFKANSGEDQSVAAFLDFSRVAAALSGHESSDPGIQNETR